MEVWLKQLHPFDKDVIGLNCLTMTIARLPYQDELTLGSHCRYMCSSSLFWGYSNRVNFKVFMYLGVLQKPESKMKINILF